MTLEVKARYTGDVKLGKTESLLKDIYDAIDGQSYTNVIDVHVRDEDCILVDMEETDSWGHFPDLPETGWYVSAFMMHSTSERFSRLWLTRYP